MSRIGRAIAILGAGATGYLKGKASLDDEERRKKDDAFRDEERAQKRKEWADKNAEREAAQRAAAPATVTPIAAQRPDTMDNRDVGQPGEPALPTVGFDVMGRRFAARPEADAAAAAANDPAARDVRVADAISAVDPERGIALRGSLMQQRMLQKQEQDREKVRDIVGTLAAGGVDAIPEIYSRYNDGMTATVKPGKDGAFTVERTDKAGKAAGKVEFAGMEDFITRAVARMNPDLYLTGEQKKRENALKERATAADEKRADAAMLAAGGRAAASKGLFERMDEADKLRYQGMLEQQKALQGEIDKALLGGMVTDDSPQVVGARKRLRDLGVQIDALHQKYDQAAGGADPAGLRQPSTAPASPAGGGGGQIDAVIADMKKSGTREADINVAGVKTRITLPDVKGKPEDAADKAVEPGDVGGHIKRYIKLNADKGKEVAGKVAESAGEKLDEARKEGSEYEAISRRVREAQSGKGKPLTDSEKALARKYAIGLTT